MQLNSTNAEVAIVKGKTPKETVLEGINKLGGINKFVNKDDQVFIKINLSLPKGFPTNSNFEVLETIIKCCKDAGAKKIYVGSFPFKSIPIKAISDLLGLKEYVESLGAELAFLDNSDYFEKVMITNEKLKQIKDSSLSTIVVKGKEFKYPKVVLNSEKLILLNQINVNPLFFCNFSLLNTYSLVPNEYQIIQKKVWKGKDYFSLDQYKQELIANILDVFTIKKPSLVINDLFYLLERAGPYIYLDSNLKKTGIIIAGNDAVAVDFVNSKIMNIELSNNNLILEARNKGLGETDLSKIRILGEKLEDIKINPEFCVKKLEDISIMNLSIKCGQICSGCFEQAYHLLNYMKTNLIKDLKYLVKIHFLIGESPLDPENIGSESVFLFGDCSINSTRDYRFRKIVKKSKKRTEIKKNKKILELPGCPPDLLNCLDRMEKYYHGKDKVPMLVLFNKMIKNSTRSKLKSKLEKWEAF